MRVLYDVDNISKLFGIKKSDVRFLANLGVIPSLDQTPFRFDKREIEEWLASGKWDVHKDRYAEREQGKGLYI